MASAIILPTSSSLPAEMVPTWAMAVAVGDGLGLLLDLADQEVGGLVDAFLQGDGVGTSGHVAQTGLDHGVGKDGGGGGAVTSGVVGLGGGLTDQSNTGVLE